MISLAVRWRPQTFADVCEQRSIVQILEKEIETNQIKNCYLFCGASGCGKTTSARIFAKRINNNVGEPIEIDAASNNSVENVRNIVKAAQERSIDSKYKVYIIDEAHALSNQAWQAFLKCIEEPPEFTIFIFCTTDPQKIPATILNRVERFNFNKITTAGIESRLKYICEQEHFTNFNEAIKYIARLANGGMRDAIANLEKCAAYSIDLKIENVLYVLGTYSYDSMFKLLNACIDGDEKNILEVLDNYNNSGSDMKAFIDQFLAFVLDVAKYSVFKNTSMLKIPASFEDELKRTIAIDNSSKYFMYVADKILSLKTNIRNDSDMISTIEVIFLQIARCK